MHGIKVPDELQLIGYDGMRLSDQQRFPVSTIVQPLKEMAEKAVQLALAKLANPQMAEQHAFFPVKFVEGFTTKNNQTDFKGHLLNNPMD